MRKSSDCSIVVKPNIHILRGLFRFELRRQIFKVNFIIIKSEPPHPRVTVVCVECASRMPMAQPFCCSLVCTPAKCLLFCFDRQIGDKKRGSLVGARPRANVVRCQVSLVARAGEQMSTRVRETVVGSTVCTRVSPAQRNRK